MSLIFGAFAKKGGLEGLDMEESVRCLSLDNRRGVERHSQGKIFFCSIISDRSCIAHSKDGLWSIAFSGQVFNFEKDAQALARKGHSLKNKKSAAEFVLHSYIEHGDRFLKDLNGIFSFALFNKATGELVLANDSFGLYPLFVYSDNEYVIFSTEYHPLMRCGAVDGGLNYDAIAEYFAFGAVLGGKTFFKNVYNLSPGTVLRAKNTKMREKRYDDLSIKTIKNEPIGYFAGKLAKSIHNAIQARVSGKKDLVFALSGGADTRLVLSNLTKSQRQSSKFMTLNHRAIKEDEENDVIIAKKIARRLGLDHRVLPRDRRKIGYSFFDMYGMSHNISGKKISALYGGEFLGGDCFNHMPVRLDSSREDVDKKLKKIFTKEFLSRISDPYDSLQDELRKIGAENKELLFNIHTFTRSFFTVIYLYGGFTTPYNFALRANSPFWDKNFLKELLTVPNEYLYDYRLYNLIYRNHYQELIDIPTNSPLALRQDSCIPFFYRGRDRKSIKSAFHEELRRRYLKDPRTWDKCFYNRDYFKMPGRKADYILASLLRFMSEKERYFLFEPLLKSVKYGKMPGFAKGIIDYIRSKERNRIENDFKTSSFVNFENWYRGFHFPA